MMARKVVVMLAGISCISVLQAQPQPEPRAGGSAPWSYMYSRPGAERGQDERGVPNGFVRRTGTLTTSELGRFGLGAWTVYWSRVDGEAPGCMLESPPGGVQLQYMSGQSYFVFGFEGVDGAGDSARAEGVRLLFDGRFPLEARPARDPDYSTVHVAMEHLPAWKHALLHAHTMMVARIDSHVGSAPWQVEMDGIVPAMAVLDQCIDGLKD